MTCVSWAPGFTLYNDDEASKYSVHAQARQIPSAALVESDFSLLLWKSGDEDENTVTMWTFCFSYSKDAF